MLDVLTAFEGGNENFDSCPIPSNRMSKRETTSVRISFTGYVYHSSPGVAPTKGLIGSWPAARYSMAQELRRSFNPAQRSLRKGTRGKTPLPYYFPATISFACPVSRMICSPLPARSAL